WSDLLAGKFVATAIDRIEKCLRQVRAGAKELHLFAHQHRRDTTGNSAVIAPGATHRFIALELNRAGFDCYLRGEAAEWIRQSRRVPDSEIRFRPGAKIEKSLQISKARFRHEWTAIVAHPANRFSHPGRIACEQLVVFRRSQKTHDAELDDKIVDDLLRLLFAHRACRQVALKIDI